MKSTALLLFVLAAAACSSSPGDSSSPDLTSPPDLAMAGGGYPAGPYGTSVGDIVQNFSFKGWFSPNATTGLATDTANGAVYADVSFDDARMSGKKFALVMFAGFL